MRRKWEFGKGKISHQVDDEARETVKEWDKNEGHERIHSRTHPAHKERGGLWLQRTWSLLISLRPRVIRSVCRGFMEKRTSWCWSPNITFFCPEGSTPKINRGQWINIKRSLWGIWRTGRTRGRDTGYLMGPLVQRLALLFFLTAINIKFGIRANISLMTNTVHAQE